MINPFFRYLFDLKLAMAVVISFTSFGDIFSVQSAKAASVQDQAKARKERVKNYRVRAQERNKAATNGTVIEHHRSDGSAAQIFIPDSKPNPANNWKFDRLTSVLNQRDQLGQDPMVRMETMIHQQVGGDRASLSESTQQYYEMQDLLKQFESKSLQRRLNKAMKPHIRQAIKDAIPEIRENARVQDAKNLRSKTFMDVVHHANVRFPIDTAMFFVAIGAVIAIELIAKNGGDPLAMQRHFESLSDPIANISFWSFIAANGISLHYMQLGASKKLLDLNHRIIFASLPMITLPFASLVSNIISDSIISIEACKEDLMTKEANKKKIYTACDEAKRQWTFANKANQYIPQILSLTVSNAPFIGLGYIAKETGHRLNAYAVAGVQTKLSQVAGKFVMSSLRIVMSPLPAIALDMLVTSAPIRIAWQTAADDYRINASKERIAVGLQQCREDLNTDQVKLLKRMPETCANLKDDLLIFRDRNQSWRQLLNSDFETAMGSYSELILKINTQFQSAQAFYAYVFKNFVDQIVAQNQCELTESESSRQCILYNALYSKKNFTLTRAYPLLGAKKHWWDVDSEKGLTKEDYQRRFQNDNTDFAGGGKNTMDQLQFIHDQSQELLKKMPPVALSKEDARLWQLLLEEFPSGKVSRVLKALEEVNHIEKSIDKNLHQNKPIFDVIKSIRESFGVITPQVYVGSGFLWARSYYETFNDTRLPEEYKISYDKYAGYKFPTTAHYFLHEMICGEASSDIRSYNVGRAVTDATIGPFKIIESILKWDHGVIEKYFEEVHNPKNELQQKIGRMFHTFAPPRITAINQDTERFCNYSPTALRISSYDDLFRLDFQDDRPSNPMLMLWNNLDPKLFDVVDKRDSTLKKDTRGLFFMDWWNQVSEPVITKFLDDARLDWGRIYAELIAGFNNSSYMQDKSKRIGIVSRTKGYLSDHTSQSKNPLDNIEAETKQYVEALRNFNFYVHKSREALKRDELLLDVLNAQQNAIKFLKGIFANSGSATNYSELLPNFEVIKPIQAELSTTFQALKKKFYDDEEDILLKEVNRDIIYGLESTINDLQKYISAGNLISRMDEEQIKAAKEENSSFKQNAAIQGTNRNGVRNTTPVK